MCILTNVYFQIHIITLFLMSKTGIIMCIGEYTLFWRIRIIMSLFWRIRIIMGSAHALEV